MAERTYVVRASGGGELPNLPRRLPRGGPRHRLGTPGLRHSRDLCRVGNGSVGPDIAPRHAAAVPPARRRLVSAVLLVTVGTVLVSGWFSISGATAFAEMIRP